MLLPEILQLWDDARDAFRQAPVWVRARLGPGASVGTQSTRLSGTAYDDRVAVFLRPAIRRLVG